MESSREGDPGAAKAGAVAASERGARAGVQAEAVGDEPQAFRAVGFMLSSLGHAVAATFSARLAPLGLEPREFALLRSVGSREGASQQATGERLGIPPSRMVALVDTLEERGLLQRRPSPSDRRAHALYQTARGKRLLAKATAVAAALEGELTEDLDAEQRARLMAQFDRMAAKLGVPPGVHGSQLSG
ncbi:MAG TPA: MarR family winged helix-turn-helix transcriptional regulator [Solirubrobacteraceae bacterium]|jgi:DNA-binding MarR family transcriptional regulator